jgi:hypothetical protein
VACLSAVSVSVVFAGRPGGGGTKSWMPCRPARPIRGVRYPHASEQGDGARYQRGLAHRLPLHAVPGCARRDSESIRQSQSADAATSRGAPATPRCDPRRSTVQDDTPRSWTNTQPGVGLARTDAEWSAALEAALTASRRVDLQHGTNAAYVKGCVCKECREHQRQRMAKSRH